MHQPLEIPARNGPLEFSMLVREGPGDRALVLARLSVLPGPRGDRRTGRVLPPHRGGGAEGASVGRRPDLAEPHHQGPKALIVLNSPGGSVEAAIGMANVIHELKLAVAVGKHRMCYAEFQDKLLSAMRYEFRGHLEKPAK